MTKFALSMLWAGLGIIAAFSAYTYLSPRIQKASPSS